MNILSNISELHTGLNVNSLKADTGETNVYPINTDLAENIFWNLSFFNICFYSKTLLWVVDFEFFKQH